MAPGESSRKKIVIGQWTFVPPVEAYFFRERKSQESLEKGRMEIHESRNKGGCVRKWSERLPLERKRSPVLPGR